MLSPHGNYFMIVSLTNKWAKEDFLLLCYDGSLYFFFIVTFIGRKIRSVLMLLLVCCLRLIHQKLTLNVLVC